MERLPPGLHHHREIIFFPGILLLGSSSESSQLAGAWHMRHTTHGGEHRPCLA